MMNFAKDLHRKGELNKVAAMEVMANTILWKKDMGSAFLTEGFYGYDAFAIIPNSPAFSDWEGYVVYDEDIKQPRFIKDNEE